MIIIKGGVTAAKGFLANGVKAGIKESGHKDLALIYSEVPAVAAGAFTTNCFQASPIKVSKLHLRNGTHQAVIVNSGNANCANGKTGDRLADLMTDYVARAIGFNKEEVLVASTGVIGKVLPIEKIAKAMPDLVSGLSANRGNAFAESIMTTDTVKKELAVKLKLGNTVVTIGGACKGVGMIYPVLKSERHATMLVFITTDADISKKMLAASLDETITETFNMISVDGDMSTNDSCFVLANGLARNEKIEKKDAGYKKFVEGLKFLSAELAKMIVHDGEGATKFVEIEAVGAKTGKDASAIARKISTSNLLKCAIYGRDPNWGRICAAAGASGVEFNPDRVDVYLGGIKALSNGAIAKDYDREKAKSVFKAKDIKIKVDLNSGKAGAKAWTCDFSKEYVAINSEYST